MQLREAFKKVFLLDIVKHIFGFWVRLLISRKVVPFLYINALSVMELHFEKTYICREIKFVIVVNVFSVSCVCFKEIFSVHYWKCIQLTQTSLKIQYSVSIIWDKVLLNARHSEICFRYLLRSFPSVSLQKRYFVFDLSKWTKTCIFFFLVSSLFNRMFQLLVILFIMK